MSDCRIHDKTCIVYRAGHCLHPIQLRHLRERPQHWRDGMVADVERQTATITYVHEAATISVWHHMPLDRWLIVGEPVSVHENLNTLQIGNRLLYVEVTLRRLFDELFPHTREVQAAYRAAQPMLLVEGGTANPGTLGAAFDYATRFALDPMYDANIARVGFLSDAEAVSNITAVNAVAQVAQAIGDRVTAIVGPGAAD
ncbi:hypothetical protein AB1K54_08730 [Microbacterium sp. BWT-B31]|uniref:hypothetical protein n=1 Tax=Microbacterium sp. BWT-B31 TaxID=3232072 RepID=UPI00352849B9